MKTETRQPYTTPRFERYGNVRDLTHSIANTKSNHGDGFNVGVNNQPGKTH